MIVWWVVISAGLMGALVDIRERRLPNLLTFPVLISGLIWNGARGGTGLLVFSALGALVAALPFLVLFGAGCGGAGDAKMMAALGAWLAWPASLWLLLAVASIGGLMGLGIMVWRGQGTATLGRIGRMIAWIFSRLPGGGAFREWAGHWPATAQMTHMPYGVAIFIGSLVAAVGVWLWD